jgi:hypothetical protein
VASPSRCHERRLTKGGHADGKTPHPRRRDHARDAPARPGDGQRGSADSERHSTPITGTTAGLPSFAGTFTLTRVAVQNGQLVAIGTLTGTVTDALGNVVGTVSQSLTIPLTASGTCAILHLTLGPLDLNLLGLLVHLNQVVLNIDAQSGPGNLLGNLLCAVAGLLDGGGPLAGISAFLNQILRILG